MPVSEIEELIEQFVKKLTPIKIYLFGSFANGQSHEDSDLDFYIVVNDNVTDIHQVTTDAYKAIRTVKRRPVDIVIGTLSRFEERKTIPSVENEVYQKGVLLYGSGN